MQKEDECCDKPTPPEDGRILAINLPAEERFCPIWRVIEGIGVVDEEDRQVEREACHCKERRQRHDERRHARVGYDVSIDEADQCTDGESAATPTSTGVW